MNNTRHTIILILLAILILHVSCKNDPEQITQSSPTIISETDPVIQGISQMVDQNPQSHELYFKRGELLYQRERYQEAAQDLNKAIAIKADVPEYYHLLADIQLDGAQSRAAVKTMENLLEKYPNRIPSYLKLSEFLLILKQHDKSISNINEIIRLDPQNADAYFLLGLNFREMGDETKALNSLQRAVEIDADMVDAWILLGNIYEQKKDPIARTYYQNAIDSDPNSLESLHTMAMYEQNQDNVNEAIDLYNKILQLDPSYNDAHLNAGILQLSIDSLDEAEQHFNLLINTNPSYGEAYYYRGLTWEMKGKTEKAIADYQSSINLNPDNNPATEALETLTSEN